MMWSILYDISSLVALLGIRCGQGDIRKGAWSP